MAQNARTFFLSRRQFATSCAKHQQESIQLALATAWHTGCSDLGQTPYASLDITMLKITKVLEKSTRMRVRLYGRFTSEYIA
jgi:hypothetical protein